jgi:prepilin-type N-terminal cleavage/methylation domain-containing protein
MRPGTSPSTAKGRSVTDRNGFSLIEVILSTAIFGLLTTALVGAYLYGVEATGLGGNRGRAALLANEGLEAVRNIRDGGYSNLTDGDHGLAVSGNQWAFSGTSDTSTIFTRHVTIASVDSVRKTVTSQVTWQQNAQRAGSVTLTTRLSRWLGNVFQRSTQAEFDAGSKDSVQTTATGDGEVKNATYGAWTTPTAVTTVSTDGTGNVNDIAVDTRTQLLYAGAGATAGDEFTAYDISNTAGNALTRTGSTSINADVNAVALSGGYAFLATGDTTQEVKVVRLSDMTQVSGFNLTGTVAATAIAVSGTVAYVSTLTSTGAEFVGLNVSNPEGTITSIGSTELTADMTSIALGTTYAFVGSASNTVEIAVVRLSDFALVNSWNLANNANVSSLALSGTTLYATRLSSADPEVLRLDASNPLGALTILNSFDAGADANDVVVGDNDRIYLGTANASQKLLILNATTLAADGSASVASTAGRAVAFVGRNAYVGGDSDAAEIAVLRGASGWTSPQLIGSLNISGTIDANAVSVSGSFAYVGTLNNSGGSPELYIINVSNPAAPALSGSIDVGGDINKIAVSGNFAYLATSGNGSELVVIDVSNPASPTAAGTFNIDENTDGTSVYVSGTTVYLGTQNNTGAAGSCDDDELYVLDAANPASITCSGSFDIGANANDIAVNGTTAYVATADTARELLVLDAATPSAITQAGAYNAAGTAVARGVAYASNTAYLATDNGGGNPDFLVLNVTTPASITLTGSLDLNSNNAKVSVSGTRAFVATATVAHGLSVIDLTTPATPTVEGNFNSTSAATGVASDSTYAYVASTDNNLEFQVVGQNTSASELARSGWYTTIAFDSTSASTLWQSISWTQSGTGTIQFQVRTAPDSGGSPGTWTDWLGPTSSSDYYTTAAGQTINSAQGDGSNDRWVQIRGTFAGNGTTTPILEEVSLTYE